MSLVCRSSGFFQVVAQVPCLRSAVAAHHQRSCAPLSWRRVLSLGLADHRDSPVAVHRWSMTLFRARADFPCRDAEADSHGPDCLSDHRVSPVASQGDRRPCLQVVQVVHIPVDAQRRLPIVQTFRRTTELLPLLDTVFDVLAAQVVQDFVVVQRQIPRSCCSP